MDFQMVVRDGYTARRATREWERAHRRIPVPILPLTANASLGDVQRSLAAGCTAHLTKPVLRLLQPIQL